MNREVKLWIIEEMGDVNTEAKELLETIPDTKVSIIDCLPSMEELNECPFTRDDRGGGYFGLQGIGYFVRENIRLAESGGRL